MTELSSAFREHIIKLEDIALHSTDEDRRLDAVRTLGIICLFVEGWHPSPPDGGEIADIIDLSAWRLKVAA